SKRCYQQGYNKGLQHQLIHNQLDLIPIYAEYNYLYQQAIQQRDEALGELDREQRWSLFFETERDELQSELAESERKGSYWEEEHQKLYFLDIRRYIFEGKFCKHSLDEKCRFLDMPNDKCLVTGETIRWRMGEPTYKGELCPKPYVAPVPENNQEETDEI
ncbi:MAG: hypothetical protein KKF27_20010, partial [Gammaproteobacteria bacterium]|nr:hypothetical protein [Gammaproteobacteria bacterium]